MNGTPSFAKLSFGARLRKSQFRDAVSRWGARGFLAYNHLKFNAISITRALLAVTSVDKAFTENFVQEQSELYCSEHGRQVFLPGIW